MAPKTPASHTYGWEPADGDAPEDGHDGSELFDDGNASDFDDFEPPPSTAPVGIRVPTRGSRPLRGAVTVVGEERERSRPQRTGRPSPSPAPPRAQRYDGIPESRSSTESAALRLRGEISRPLSTRGSVPPPPVSRRSDPGRGGLSEPLRPVVPAQRARAVAESDADARVARLQMAVALIVGLLLAMSLYVWRRPRTEPAAPVPEATATLAPVPSAPPLRDLGTTPIHPGNPNAPAPTPAGTTKIAVSEARTIGCGNGGRRLLEEGCERLPDVEKALVNAVQASASCLGPNRGGTIEYQADIHFEGRKVSVLAPRAGRTVQGTKAVTGCALAVKRALSETLPWEVAARKHDHLRVAVVASY